MKRLFILFAAMSTMTIMAQTSINIIMGGQTFTAALGSDNVSVQFVQADISAVQHIYSNKIQCTKVMKNGVLFINHNAAMYNVLGEKVQ